jgi:hypothetical protein
MLKTKKPKKPKTKKWKNEKTKNQKRYKKFSAGNTLGVFLHRQKNNRQFGFLGKSKFVFFEENSTFRMNRFSILTNKQ